MDALEEDFVEVIVAVETLASGNEKGDKEGDFADGRRGRIYSLVGALITVILTLIIITLLVILRKD